MMNIKAILFLPLLAIFLISTPVLSQEKVDLSQFRKFDSSDWRKPSFINGSLYTPVLVKDEFDGSTNIAVFSKSVRSDFNGTIVINWSSKSIGVYSYIPAMEDWLTGSVPVNENNQPNNMSILINGKTFDLEGKRGNFKVTKEIAYALKTVSAEEVKIKMEFANSNDPIIIAIGKGSIESWKTVYRDAKSPS
jgi:hypothetical protein